MGVVRKGDQACRIGADEISLHVVPGRAVDADAVQVAGNDIAGTGLGSADGVTRSAKNPDAVVGIAEVAGTASRWCR